MAVITGGTRGIGRGIAEAFAARGATVVMGGKTPAKGEQALDEMGIGDRAMFVACDVRRREDVHHLIDTAASRYGGVDILVNNAGGSDGFALVHEMSVEEVAAMATLLASDLGGGITGALINVDGGTAQW